VKVSLSVNGIETPTTFFNVLHIPEIRHSLFSIARVIDRGINLDFKKENVEILQNEKLAATGRREWKPSP
jgi:hypothetical protein